MNFTLHDKSGVVFMTAPNIETTHGFTTRRGGVSTGIFESLDLSESRGDDPEAVAENFRRVKAALKIDGDFVFSKQVHETEIRVASRDDVRRPFAPLEYEADGLITNIANLPLIIFTADCAPVLLYDPVAGAVGAVHAGWRGAMADICGKAVRKMASEFGSMPENIRVAIGPAIGKCCFETGTDVYDAMVSLLGSDERAEKKENGKYMIDLRGAAADTLVMAGVERENILISDECTMCSHDKYWSHRYTAGQRGTQASIIMLKGNGNQ